MLILFKYSVTRLISVMAAKRTSGRRVLLNADAALEIKLNPRGVQQSYREFPTGVTDRRGWRVIA
jgi:hypothetical protein